MSNEAKGVSSCYVFKSRLQEYAQKVGFSTPAYETIKEGPSHEPFFRSTVIVNNNRYDSLHGFSNRKAAEQSAAEIALIELAKCNDKKDCISQPVHELGLCKNLLQEYAQKMNYAMPMYECKKVDTTGRGHYSCSVDIGGIRYIGAVARTKKEAEIKAARTALLAIQTSSSEMGDYLNEETNFTVVPPKRKDPSPKKVVVKTRKTKRARMKNKYSNKKRKLGEDSAIQAESDGVVNNGVPSENRPLEDMSASEGLLKSNDKMSDCQPISVSDVIATSQDVNNSHGVVSNEVPSEHSSLDVPVSASEGLLKSNGKMLDCQPISCSDPTIQDGTSSLNNNCHGDVNNKVPSENGSLDVPESLNMMNQSPGDTSASESLLKFNDKMSDCQQIPVHDTTSQDGTSNVNNSHGAVNIEVPSENGSLDVPLSLNMNQSRDDTSASESLLKSNDKMSDCQVVSESDTTIQDGTSPNMNQIKGDTLASEGLLKSNTEMSDCPPVSVSDITYRDGTSNVDNNHGAVNNDVKSEGGSLDVPESPNMIQSHGDMSDSEGLLKTNSKMSDCQPISVSDPTCPDGTSAVNNGHGEEFAGHEIKEGKEGQPVSMDVVKPLDEIPTGHD